MQNRDYYSRRAVNERRRLRRRRIVRRRIFLCLFTVIFAVTVVGGGIFIYSLFNPHVYDDGFVPSPFGVSISKKVTKAKELELPDWVDVQLIHKHTTARTGIYLKDIKNIVIHYVGNPNTTARNNRDYFDKADTTVSSHFIVGLDGEIIQCVPLYEKSAASNNRNKDTISIEVCHPDDTGKYSDKTYESVIKLASFLCHNFSLDEKDIIRHYDITGKICPKYYVENEDAWETLKEDVKEKLDEYEEN